MKKILLVAAVAGLAMASCKKDYTCECTVTDTSNGTVMSSSSYTAKLKKKDADSWCTGNTTATAGTLKSECKLK